MSKPVVNFTSLLDRAALEHLKSKTLLPSFSHYDVWLYEHAVGFTVAKMMNADLLQTTQNALVQAMESGESYDKFVKKLKPYLMSQGWWGETVMTDPVDGVAKTVQLGSTRRLRVIFQTNMATAYAAGQWARVQEDKREFPFLKYIASTAEQKRQSHMTYYGKIWRVDDPIWQSIFPPNGYGCQCTVRQLTEKQALRERGEDIDKQPENFTEQQKANHKKGVIDDGTDDIQWREFVNPRTGQKVQVPFDVSPSFAHNHSDRMGALQKLLQEKHGTPRVVELEQQLNAYLINKLNMENVQVVDFSAIHVPKSEVERFLIDPLDNKEKHDEATLAAQWQTYFDVQLARFEPPPAIKGEKTMRSPDFIVVADKTGRQLGKTLEMMFTLSESDNTEYFLRSFNKSDVAWEKSQKNIIKHLDKGDIIPMYLKHFDVKTRSKLILFVLSLPKAQQSKIVFVL